MMKELIWQDVKLVPLGAAHLDKTFEWVSQKELRTLIDSQGAPSLEKHLDYWAARLSDERHAVFAVLAENEKHLGNCGLADIDRVRRKAEMWIYLPETRRRGFGRSAGQALLRFAFDDLNLNRIYVRVLDFNSGALEYFRGLGFVDEGLLRADTIVDGRPVNSHVLGLLKSEWAI
jgi:RimJ/RimL family protein N-acetyltransferase